MRRPHQIAAGVLAACALLLVPSRARAQDTTDTSSSGSSGSPDALAGEKPQENGFKIGPGRLHLFLTEGLVYNSQAVAVPVSPGSSTYTLGGAFILHTRPGLNLNIDGDNNTFGLNGYIDYLYYTNWITAGASEASTLNAAAGLNGDFNRNGAVGFTISDTFSRSANTYTPSVAVGVISLYNQVSVGVPIRPGGRALEIVPHGAYGVEAFTQYSGAPTNGSCNAPNSPCNPATLEQYNYQDFEGGVDVRLKFLPETAAIFTSNYDARIYSNTTVNPNASELKLQIGLAGLITTKLSAILKAGWAQGFGTGEISTVIGQAEVSWLPTELATLTVGFLRDVYPVSGYGSYIDDRPYLSGKIFLGGRLQLSLTAAYDFFDYASSPQNPTGRNDSQLSFNAAATYQVARWFLVGGGLLFTYHTSSLDVNSTNYTQWEPYVEVTFTY
jgi:Putative beta-barrel porin 2